MVVWIAWWCASHMNQDYRRWYQKYGKSVHEPECKANPHISKMAAIEKTARDTAGIRKLHDTQLLLRLGLKVNVSVIRLQAKMEAWKHTGLERPDTVVLTS
ncbi:hypothetical protein Tco_1241865 [Tanacetum coccineum]